MRLHTRTITHLLASLAVSGATLAAPRNAAATPAHAQPHHAHVDEAVTRAGRHGNGPQRVIVRTKPDAGGQLRQHLQARGKHVRTEHPGIGALTVTLTSSEIDALALDPSVESVSIDADVSSEDSKKSGSTSTTSTSTT